MACANIPGACRHAIPLGAHLKDLLLYRESAQLQQQVAERINERVIQRAIADRDESVSVLLNDLGDTWNTLGNANKAIGFVEEALQIFQAVFRDDHPNVALRYNNLGATYHDLGEAAKARNCLTRAFTVFTAVYGREHPHTQTVRANLEQLGRQP